MNNYQELVILLPCHSLEDFPVHHEGDDAEGLLAGWSALWHPRLLASAGAAPTWSRVDDPPEELSGRLIVIPSVSQAELQTGFPQRACDAGATVIRGVTGRGELLEKALKPLGPPSADLDPEITADFLALGTCLLLVELLTRQMRYSSNLDELHFNNQALEGAQAAVAGDHDKAREKLTACFDLLAEERDHYYSVDAYLLDLTLVAPTTLGTVLAGELVGDAPRNLLLPADAVVALQEDPPLLNQLREAVDQGRVSVLGGERDEWRNVLLDPESILANLQRGRAVYEQALGMAPRVFGRRRFGLTPLLPQILHHLGFEGALHATLEEGRFPEGGQVKTRWEGTDGTALDAIARAPHNALRAETYLGLAGKLGETMDMDHVATICIAHWPGQTSDWLSDLRRIARYGSPLGKLIAAEHYFRDTDLPGHHDRFDVDQYRSPYLKQAVIRKLPSPIEQSIHYSRRRRQVEALNGLQTLAAALSGKRRPETEQQTEELGAAVDRALEVEPNGTLDATLGEQLTTAGSELATALGATETDRSGCLLLNPLSFVRRVALETGEPTSTPAVEKPIYAAHDRGQERQLVVDVPPMGFAWVGGGGTTSPRSTEVLADECLLRNEFMEVLVHPDTGALKSIHEYQVRGNRLSQQLAFRLSESDSPRRRGDSAAGYSRMVAESVKIESATPVRGVVESRGRLEDGQGELLANFVQRFELWRGSRVLRLAVTLEPKRDPRPDPWKSYYAMRFAWADESATLSKAINQTRHPIAAKRFEAPHYIEIDDGKTQTTLLTNGLPYHCRTAPRMLDTLLIVAGQSGPQTCEIGVGINLPQPMHAALSEFAPVIAVPRAAPPASGHQNGWLVHISARNVVITHTDPVVDDSGRVIGLRARMLETQGKNARCAVRCFRNLTAGQSLDFRGQTLAALTIEDGKALVEMTGHQWQEIELVWD